MKRHILTLALLAATVCGTLAVRADGTNPPAATTTNAMAASTNAVAAAPATPAPTNAPTVEQRLESIEAYFQNGDPTATYKDTNGNWTTSFAAGPSIINTNLINSTGAYVSYPGAGHNAWLLTSTAFVLFMTLPGLALFYGGLVRRKNVLSVLAQCFLITGLVTILWVICGQGGRHQRHCGQSQAGLDDEQRHLRAQPQLFLLGVGKRLRHVPVDVRRHHPRPDRRRHCRTHEVLGHPGVHDPVDVHRLLHPGPHGLGHQRPDERVFQRERQDSRH
jgi:hypothetical protein